MLDTIVSVDEILDELKRNKIKEISADPKRDMQQINDMVEQILTQKKNKIIEKENVVLTPKELECFEKEIKSQTKSITKQYEKILRENTKQIKQLEREEKAIERELRIDSNDVKAFDNANSKQNNITQPIKILNVASEQKIKLQKPLQDNILNEEKRDKIEFLKNSANTDHIKREQNDITTHFGTAKLSQNQVERQIAQTPISPYNYRKLKKNRDEKIDRFTLETNEDEKDKTEIIENDDNKEMNLADAVLNKLNENEQQEANAEQSTIEDENFENVENLQNQFEYIKETQKNNAKSRLEIKQKLNNMEKSVKISIYGLIIVFLSAIVLSFVGVSNGVLMLAGKISIDPLIYIEANMMLIIIATIFSKKVFFNAIEAISNNIPEKDLLYSLSIIICFVRNIMLLFSPEKLLVSGVHLYTPIVLIGLLFNYISKSFEINKIIDDFDYISSDEDKYSTIMINDFKVSIDMTRGIIEDQPRLVKNIKTNFCKDFLTHSFHYDLSDVVCTKLALWGLPISLILAAIAFILSKNIFISMTILTGVFAILTTFIGAFIVSFPLHDTSKVTKHFSSMSPCVEAIDEFSETNSILIDAYDLFPAETVILHGIKTFSGKRIDEAIIDAASVVCQSKSILSNVFLNVIANNTELLKPVDSIVHEDLMGISAWVDNKRVLVGNRDLMINHSIAVPKKDYEDKYKNQGRDVVYLSREGELCAAFIIQLTTKKETFDVVNLLERNDIKVIVKTVDSLLTSEKLSAMFNMEIDMFKILPSRLHKTYATETQPVNSNSTILGNNGNILGYIISVVATKKLSYCVKFGVALNLVCIILGVISLITMFFIGKLGAISCLAILIYMSVFGIFYWIYQKNIHL